MDAKVGARLYDKWLKSLRDYQLPSKLPPLSTHNTMPPIFVLSVPFIIAVYKHRLNPPKALIGSNLSSGRRFRPLEEPGSGAVRAAKRTYWTSTTQLTSACHFPLPIPILKGYRSLRQK